MYTSSRPRRILSFMIMLAMVFAIVAPALPAQAAPVGKADVVVHYNGNFTYPAGFNAELGTVSITDAFGWDITGSLNAARDKYTFTGLETTGLATLNAAFPGYELKAGPVVTGGVDYKTNGYQFTPESYAVTQIYLNVVPLEQTYYIEYYLQNADGSFSTPFGDPEERTAPTATTVYATTDGTAEGEYRTFPGYTASPSISVVSGTIPDSGNLTLKVYYTHTTNNQYTVKYVNQNGETILPNKVVTGQAMDVTVTETPPAIPGYTAPVPQEITVNNDPAQAITFVYTGNAVNYSVRYVDEAGNELQDPTTGNGTVGDSISESAPAIVGYDTPSAQTLQLSADVAENTITFMYTQNTTSTLPYTVEYYKGAEQMETRSHDVWAGDPTVDLNTIDTTNVPTGYSLDRYEFGNSPATGTVTIDETNNVIKVFYKIDNTSVLPYVVNYYKDGNLLTYEMKQTLAADPQVATVTDQTPAGYKLEKINFMDGTVSDDTAIPANGYTITSANNVINVYYVKDETQTYSYRIDYCRDGETTAFANSDTLAVPVYHPQVNSVDTATHMPAGYKVKTTDPASFPVVLTDDTTVITVTYEKDDSQTLPYTIEYYKDGNLMAYNPNNSVPVHTPQVDLASIDQTNLPAGYELDRMAFGTTDPATGSVTITSANKVIKVYYAADADATLAYTVRYFKDGSADPFDTSTGLTVPISDPRVLSVNTANMPAGYMLDTDNAVTFPVTITTTGQFIDVYYVPNPDANLSYSVEHYKIMPGQTKDTATLYQTQAGSVPMSNPAVTATAITIPGYVYDTDVTGTLPGTITQNGQVIKLYYAVDTSEAGQIFDYNVHYYLEGTNQPVPGIDQNTGGNATPSGQGYSGEVITLLQPDLTNGYKVVASQPTELTVTENGNATATIYYTVDTAQNVYGYTVNYLLPDDSAVPGTTPQTGTGAIGSTVTISYPVLTNGYKRAPGQPDTFVLDVNNKTINVYYEADAAQTLTYTVEYYQDGTRLDGATQTAAVPILTPTVTLENLPNNQLPLGYAVDHYEFGNSTATTAATGDVTITDDNNLIKVFYTPDDTQTYQYTVNYYRDGNTLIDTKTATVPMANPQVTAATTIDGTAIQTVALPDGYRLANNSTPLPATISPTNYIINVYYEPNPDGEYTYTVNYYVMEKDPDTGLYTVQTTTPVPGVTPNPVTGNGVAGEVINIAQLPGSLGYMYISGPSALIIDGAAAATNTAAVYYAKDESKFADYTVRHVAIDGDLAVTNNGLIAEETIEGKIGDTVYGQPRAVTGYTYQPAGSASTGTVSADGLTLTLNYTVSNALSYTVSYVDASGKAIAEPVVHTDAAWKAGDTISIPASDGKTISGYTLRAATLPSTLQLSNEGNEIKLVYDINSYGYTAHYYEAGSTTSLLPDKTGTAQAFGASVIESAPVIPGYTVDGDSAQLLTITENTANNVITFYYLTASESPVLNPVLTSDTIVTGKAALGSVVTLTFPGTDGNPISVVVTADAETGEFSAEIPAGADRTAGRNISATAAEAGKGESNPVTTAFIADTDGDGLSDDEEATFGTDLNLADTDGDGLTDYEEVYGTKNTAFNNQPTDPLRKDTDGDSISDHDEILGTDNNGVPTDPNRKDTDGDGWSDDYERDHGTDPNSKNA